MRLPGLFLAAACVLAAPASLLANTYTVVLDASASWSQAKTAAQLAGGYLATITSASENAAVVAAIAAASPPAQGSFWINLREQGECCYVWDTGETTCYGNFYRAEPNDGEGTVPEDRGAMLWSSDLTVRGFWNDVPEAGFGGSGLFSRAGYVIEFGPLDPAASCGTCLPVNPASFCDTPAIGAHVVVVQLMGTATGPGEAATAAGTLKRTITDVTEPSGPARMHRAGVQAVYQVTVPIASGTTAAQAAVAFRDSINRQAGFAGFHAQFPTPGNTGTVRMHRPSGPAFVSVDENTVPGLSHATIYDGPVLASAFTGAGLAALALVLLTLGSFALRRRRRVLT